MCMSSAFVCQRKLRLYWECAIRSSSFPVLCSWDENTMASSGTMTFTQPIASDSQASTAKIGLRFHSRLSWTSIDFPVDLNPSSCQARGHFKEAERIESGLSAVGKQALSQVKSAAQLLAVVTSSTLGDELGFTLTPHFNLVRFAVINQHVRQQYGGCITLV